jgi:hypothetical protein
MQKQFIATVLAAVALSPLAAHAQAAGASTAANGTGASAQTAAAPTVGAKVFDPQGAEVGTVEKVEGGNAVVYTGTKRATLPAAAFGKSDKGLLISMTQAQLNAAVADAEAKTSSAMSTALVADAQVKSRDGTVVGTVQKVEGDNVTINLTDGGPVTVTKQYLSIGAGGGLALTMSAAELKSAVSAAAGQSAANGSAGASTGSTTPATGSQAPSRN